jgi:hypothetical protein
MAEAWNMYDAVSSFPDAFSNVLKFFNSGKSEDEEDKNTVIIVLGALASGVALVVYQFEIQSISN